MSFSRSTSVCLSLATSRGATKRTFSSLTAFRELLFFCISTFTSPQISGESLSHPTVLFSSSQRSQSPSFGVQGPNLRSVEDHVMAEDGSRRESKGTHKPSGHDYAGSLDGVDDNEESSVRRDPTIPPGSGEPAASSDLTSGDGKRRQPLLPPFSLPYH